VRYLQRACDAGYGHSCAKLAAAYASGGYGVTADPGKSASFFKRACSAGDKDSCAKAR
jgi:TPR repeat protein